jgi:nucleoid-associated protein YgaU
VPASPPAVRHRPLERRQARAAPVAARPSGGSRTPPARPAQGGLHLVQAGDTLWSLAAARLGPGASAAQIAHEVDRLWSLNRDRIASGDPDLIRVGERLRLD